MTKSSRQILQDTKIANSRMKTKWKAKVFSELKSVKQQIRIPKVFEVSGKTKLYLSYLFSCQLCSKMLFHGDRKIIHFTDFPRQKVSKNYRQILPNNFTSKIFKNTPNNFEKVFCQK